MDHQRWLEAVRALLHAVDATWQALAAHAGMNINDVVTLELLHFTDRVSATALRTRTGLSASAVTGLIDRLEDRGLVVRVRPRHNRRLVLVELTDTGRHQAAALFGPLLGLLDDPATAVHGPAPGEQLPTLQHLIALFEHTAARAARFPVPPPPTG